MSVLEWNLSHLEQSIMEWISVNREKPVITLIHLPTVLQGLFFFFLYHGTSSWEMTSRVYVTVVLIEMVGVEKPLDLASLCPL